MNEAIKLADDLIVLDWEDAMILDLDWKDYVGPQVREVFNTLPYELRYRIFLDAKEMANDEWNRGISAMGAGA